MGGDPSSPKTAGNVGAETVRCCWCVGRWGSSRGVASGLLRVAEPAAELELVPALVRVAPPLPDAIEPPPWCWCRVAVRGLLRSGVVLPEDGGICCRKAGE